MLLRQTTILRKGTIIFPHFPCHVPNPVVSQYRDLAQQQSATAIMEQPRPQRKQAQFIYQTRVQPAPPPPPSVRASLPCIASLTGGRRQTGRFGLSLKRVVGQALDEGSCGLPGGAGRGYATSGATHVSIGEAGGPNFDGGISVCASSHKYASRQETFASKHAAQVDSGSRSRSPVLTVTISNICTVAHWKLLTWLWP